MNMCQGEDRFGLVWKNLVILNFQQLSLKVSHTIRKFKLPSLVVVVVGGKNVFFPIG